MTRTKKILVTAAIAVAAVGGTSASAFANTHVTVTPDNIHISGTTDAGTDNIHISGTTDAGTDNIHIS
ncbi:hypothetical protein [Streptomyces sp. NPDC001020]